MENRHPLAIDAVRKTRENGHKVLLCTDRNMPIISKDILEVGFMVLQQVQECMKILHKFGVYCRIEAPNEIYMDTQMEELVKNAIINELNPELIRMKKCSKRV